MKKSRILSNKDSDDEEQQGRLSSSSTTWSGGHEDEKILRQHDGDRTRYLLDEVHQLKAQQARQHDDFCALQSLQEDSMNTLRDEIRALELKIAGLMTNEGMGLSSITNRSGNEDTGGNDDFSTTNSRNPVVRGVQLGPGDDSSMFHPQQSQQSKSTRTRRSMTGITETIQSILHKNDAGSSMHSLSKDEDLSVMDDHVKYPKEYQEDPPQIGFTDSVLGRGGSPTLASSENSISLFDDEKRGASGNGSRMLDHSISHKNSSEIVHQGRGEGREHVKDAHIRCMVQEELNKKSLTKDKTEGRKLRRRSLFSFAPVPSGTNTDNKEDEDGITLEEDTFSLMMLNKVYSPIPYYVYKIIANCIRILCIAIGLTVIGFNHFDLEYSSTYGEYLLNHLFDIALYDAIGLTIIFGSRRISLLFTRILRPILNLSGPWFLGMVTFAVFQLTLGISIIVDQWSMCTEDESTDAECIPFDIPTKVAPAVNVSQFVAVVLVLATQRDIFSSLQTVYKLRNAEGVPWDRVIGEEGNRTWPVWVLRILMPNVLKFVQAGVVLFTSFIIIVQSSRTLDLLKDFTALLIVSDADNIMFDLADMGYFGEYLQSKTEEVKNGVSDRESPALEEAENVGSHSSVSHPIEIQTRAFAEMTEGCNEAVSNDARRTSRLCGNFRLNYLVCAFSALCGIMIASLSYCVAGQWNGKWVETKYPGCKVLYPRKIDDGNCDIYAPYFTIECGWDGGDCTETMGTSAQYSNCTVANPNVLGDGYCDDYLPNNSEECGYDGGDCIRQTVDGYPDCLLLQEDHDRIGDGVCDSWPPFYTLECGYDGGDCDTPKPVDGYPDCFVPYPEFIGDGLCYNFAPYNTPNCEYDGGDCGTPKAINGNSNCFVPYLDHIGNGHCNDYPPYNTPECEYDGGDCPHFKEKISSYRPQLL